MFVHTENLVFFHIDVIQVPFYPPQQKVKDFSSEVISYLFCLVQ